MKKLSRATALKNRSSPLNFNKPHQHCLFSADDHQWGGRG